MQRLELKRALFPSLSAWCSAMWEKKKPILQNKMDRQLFAISCIRQYAFQIDLVLSSWTNEFGQIITTSGQINLLMVMFLRIEAPSLKMTAAPYKQDVGTSDLFLLRKQYVFLFCAFEQSCLVLSGSRYTVMHNVKRLEHHLMAQSAPWGYL